MKARKWPWGRILAAAAAVVLVLLAVTPMLAVVELRRRAIEAETVEPIHLKVDLSQPGEYRGKFRHTYNKGWGHYLQVLTEPLPASPEDAMPIVEGLTGHLAIVGRDGAVVYEKDFGPNDFDCRWIAGDRWVPVMDFGRFPVGVYELRFTVTHGAANLAGIPHALVGCYRSDGMEFVVAQVVIWIGTAACAVAGILVLVIVGVTLYKRRGNVSQVGGA